MTKIQVAEYVSNKPSLAAWISAACAAVMLATFLVSAVFGWGGNDAATRIRIDQNSQQNQDQEARLRVVESVLFTKLSVLESKVDDLHSELTGNERR